MLNRNKHGNILTENVIFIVLNIVFLTILALFLFLKTSDVSGLEEKTAKNIALMIDAAEPGMSVEFSIEKAEKNEWFQENFRNSVLINGNEVMVKLNEDGGYVYSFFNDVDVGLDVGPRGNVFITINEKGVEDAGAI